MTCTIKNKKIWALLLAVVMMISVFSICAIASDDGETETTTSDVILGVDAPDTVDDSGSSVETTTTAAAATTTDSTDGTTTTAAAETTTTTTAATETEKKSWVEEHTNFLIATGVIVFLFILYFALRLFIPKFKAKTDKFWKDYNAEFKKLIWPTKSQLVKNTTVVLVTIVIFAVVLALLDFGLTKGIYALKDLVDLIRPAA